MTNLYLLWKGGTVPSLFSKEASWDGRFLKFTNDVENHGVTGGNDSHEHVPSYGIGEASSVSVDSYTAGLYVIKGHTHGAPASPTGLEGDNDPPYYDLELIKIDLETFESSGCLPVGAVIPALGVLSESQLSRLSAADGKLIRLGTAGTNGGTSDHGHTVAGDVASSSSSSDCVRTSGLSHSSQPTCEAHSHSTEITTDSKSNLPKRIQTRLYEVVSLVGEIPAGIIGFVDGVPSEKWESVGWDDAFLEPTDQDAASAGQNTHNHNGNGTSGDYTATPRNQYYGYSGSDSSRVEITHNHSVELTLLDADHQPRYVTLYPVRLVSSIGIPRSTARGCIVGIC